MKSIALVAALLAATGGELSSVRAVLSALNRS